MEKKFKVTYNENNVQSSVPYILVKEFDLHPNILKAEIDGDGTGMLVVSIEGDMQVIDKGVQRLRDEGFLISPLNSHIHHDEGKCWSCGACVSQCPTHSIRHDPDTMEVVLNVSTCIACGSCVNACSVHALNLVL